MGVYFIDQYSLLHFSAGVIVYFFGIDFGTWYILHMLFEILENTDSGVKFIDKKLTFWPGGKKSPDTLINSIGDQFFAMLGFIIAIMLNNYGKKHNWHSLPI